MLTDLVVFVFISVYSNVCLILMLAYLHPYLALFGLFGSLFPLLRFIQGQMLRGTNERFRKIGPHSWPYNDRLQT